MSEVTWCEGCRMRVGIDVDCDIEGHVHRPLTRSAPDDIVTRLRCPAELCICVDVVLINCVPCNTRLDAANAIEARDAKIEQLRAELADAYDACRYALADSPRWQALAETVVHTYEENRRG